MSETDLDAYVKELVDTFPPLSQEQRDRLWVLLAPARRAILAGRAPGDGQAPAE